MPRLGEGMRELSMACFVRPLSPFVRALVSWPYHQPKTPPPNIIALGGRFPHKNCGGLKHLVCCTYFTSHCYPLCPDPASSSLPFLGRASHAPASGSSQPRFLCSEGSASGCLCGLVLHLRQVTFPARLLWPPDLKLEPCPTPAS